MFLMLKFEPLYPRDFQAHFYVENNYYTCLQAIFLLYYIFIAFIQTLTKQSLLFTNQSLVISDIIRKYIPRQPDFVV